MVSDEELVGRLQSLLCQVDLTRATVQGIREQLEGEFGVELGNKDEFLRHHIAVFMQCHYPSAASYYHPNLAYNPPPVSSQHCHMVQQHPHIASVRALDAYMDGNSSLKAHQSYEEPTTVSASVPQEGKKRCRAGGLNKVCDVSPELQAIVGEPKMPRTQIVKQLWAYIRANNLQDPNNKRNIICDDALRLVFDTDSTDMFQMNKLLARHIKTIDAKDDTLEPNPKRIANETSFSVNPVGSIAETVTSADGDVPSPESLAASDSTVPISDSFAASDTAVPISDSIATSVTAVPLSDSFAATDTADPVSDSFAASDTTVSISEPLASFLETDESEMSRDEVLRRLNDYIKANNLQDASNEGIIICDENLQKLFLCQNFAASEMTKLLAPHFSRS